MERRVMIMKRRMICKPTKKKLFLLIFSLSCIICLILLVIFPKNKYLIAERGIANIEISNTSLGSLSEPDISLILERKFVENEFGEKILIEKEYFAKYFGTITDTWKWIDENGEIQQKEVRNSIEWESKGTPNPLDLTKPEFQPTYKDEISPPPVENARLVNHKFEGWVNDAVLWSRWKAVARYKEEPTEKERQFI